MRPTLSLEPLLPLPQAIAFGLAAIVLAAWLYRQRAAGPGATRAGAVLGTLRSAAVAAIALLVLNPVWLRAAREAGKPPVLILLDTSQSMAVRDAGGERRIDAARRAAMDEGLLQLLARRHAPSFYSVGETATREEADRLRTRQPDGRATRLGESLSAALGTVSAPSGAVVLVSDGRNNGEADPVQVARMARAKRFAVFTVCVGGQTEGRDVSVLTRRPQVYAVPGQSVTLSAEARSVGYSGQTTQAHLLKDGKVVATRNVTLDDRRPVTLSFDVAEAKAGSYRYGLAVAGMPRELVTSNNRCSVLLQVQDAHVRVLVLEGRPTWDAKFMLQALHTDPSIQVDAIYKLSDQKFFAVRGVADPNQRPEMTAKVPATAAELSRYDVVVLGKGYEEFYDEKGTTALKQFVSDRGGSLVFLRGEAAERTPALKALEPVQWSDDQVRDLRLQLTDEGAAHPAFSFRSATDPRSVVQQLPKLISATRVESERALSVVLARAPDVPESQGSKEMAILAYQSYGQGKVVSLGGHGLWRWAFLPPDLKDYAGCYNDFWTQLVRWLVSQSDFLPGQDVSLRTDHASYALGDTVNVLAYVRGTGGGALPPVRITQPDGRTTDLQLAKGGGAGDFAGAYKPAAEGEHLATLARPRGGALVVPFSVYPDRQENTITAADPELMRQIAEAGGGAALAPSQLDDLPGKLQEAQAVMSTRHESRSAWDRGWVLGVILLLLSAEWFLRRRWGLA